MGYRDWCLTLNYIDLKAVGGTGGGREDRKHFVASELYLWSLMGQRFQFSLSLSGQLRW